jgi:hypothetical protein
MLLSRLMIVLFGAVPGTVLGSFAVGVTFGGLRGLASAEASGALFVVWGLLGLLGLTGLWLAVLVGPGSPVASGLIACGLAADAALLVLVATNSASAAPIAHPGHDAAYVLLLTLPFLVGAAYICHAVLRARRPDPRQHGAV